MYAAGGLFDASEETFLLSFLAIAGKSKVQRRHFPTYLLTALQENHQSSTHFIGTGCITDPPFCLKIARAWDVLGLAREAILDVQKWVTFPWHVSFASVLFYFIIMTDQKHDAAAHYLFRGIRRITVLLTRKILLLLLFVEIKQQTPTPPPREKSPVFHFSCRALGKRSLQKE